MDDAEAEGTTAFPRLVTWGSLGVALLLFFGTTVPALHEQGELHRVEVQTRELRDAYRQALAEARQAGRGRLHERQEDLQALLVAIDRLGLTPAELLQAYPPPAGAGAGTEERGR